MPDNEHTKLALHRIMVKLHYYQAALLKKLVSAQKGKRFNGLLIEGLGSEHMNYHLKQLIKVGFVKKDGTLYILTDAGKDYSNILDDQVEIVEKQPKTSIIIWGVRQNTQTGKVEHLLMRRLRHPYYGKVGRITGKVRFGETMQQAAARELYEETGLTAKKYQLDKIYHKIRHRSDGEVVQDVVFYLFFVTEFSGDLIEHTSFQDNFWIDPLEVSKRKDLDVYDDFEADTRTKPHAHPQWIESVAEAEGF